MRHAPAHDPTSWARFTLAIGCAAALAAGCVVKTQGDREWVRNAASREFSCPGGKLTIVHYTGKPDKKGAVGCGKRAVFREYCKDGTCKWHIDPNAPPPKLPSEKK